MAIIGYARVSTQDQDLSLQLDALKAAGCTKIFSEHASGGERGRPQLMAAMEYMRPGDTLVVWKLDRLARSLKQLLDTLTDLDSMDIQFRSLTEKIDTTSAMGKLLFHIMGALAEFERSMASERTIAGLESARRRGKRGGRKRKLTDEDIHAAGLLLKDESITVDAVATRFGVSRKTLYRYIPAAKTNALVSG